MKKWTFFLALLLLAALPSAGLAEPVATAAPVATPQARPLYADQIAEGTYAIAVSSSSSMFRVVDAQLTVKDGAMTCVITMSGKGYGKLYMGTGEQALADTEESHIPCVVTAEKAVTFEVPVEALDMGIDCAAWSIKKEKWYDRVLVFQSAPLPAEALMPAEADAAG
ncbi:MAG: hypothetical protein VB065_07365 [Eubacteriales bacterium]|nr:hypothetical protein [Eubacteriales bacterium]